MRKYLPIGSVVRLNKGDTKLMIVSRFPLYKDGNDIGYFEYCSCIFPSGVDGKEFIFFNKEDIAEVYFEGYVDVSEEEAQRIFSEQENEIEYPKFRVDKTFEENS
ncbi:MAG: DUF4176 domain-containing protein [Streptococcus gordonii]|uniref:DUF4176 domain-containing protein n=1 Tax=Streptococcus gordonii TaxID=1302 RepID=UPI001C8CB837|nr:DUF4176 domain-containing protein [Streptococcus gordonii]MBN2958878.1 DUF4176 domain-containing protein [Streptococcus gordonii]MBX9096871.1 DUF4176 domain-containing protein [Streptococcus gordonii]